ncbi:hypothetical protein PHAVU_003G164800 [Phaseolus vulgaris]|uniref:Receptor-like serine/threonine-protein kinase n=1 Tax=Phaseolus vulgaris TaxID=3885 RepID=V7CCC1_PHAVU|nr:hypothetical protein PHAVU_003G164800g [Phaseolus vulgaris]ESW26998.1 hypothetical protein PHAVU_003G164800g [Phaseolus vulgaris]
MDIIAVIIITCLFLMSLATRVETQQIALGATLEPKSTTTNAFWLSPSAQFAFGFYPQEQGGGFVVAIWLVSGENKTVVWTAQRNDPPVTSGAKLQLNMDGKLVLTDEQGEEKVIADNSSAKALSASVLDSGNFVLYSNNNNIIWQSFDYPTDTLLGGQSLPNGHQLVCSSSENNHSSGRFRIKVQDDGNLVLYPVDTTDTVTNAYWISNYNYFDRNTFARNPFKDTQRYIDQNGTRRIVNESSDGRTMNVLSVVSDDGNQIIYRATLNYDGLFHLYAHFKNGSIKNLAHWPQDRDMCLVKGFCGFNSYCTYVDDQPVCSCLSGFISIHPNDSTLGCKRSFPKEDCRGKKDSTTSYEMKSKENIALVDGPYLKNEMSQQECSATCLADCNCEAASYDGTNCMKQRLPLRYLRWTIENDGSRLQSWKVGMLLWKVGDSLSNRTGSDNPVPEQPPIKVTSNKATVHIIVITSIFSLLLCSTIVISSHYMYKIRLLKYKRLKETGNLGLNEEVTLRRFSYSELKRATNNFKIELGKGSFGAVYKGALEKGKRLIAVKRLEKLVEEGESEFQAEMRAIGKTRHRNLVRLLGFCAEGSKRLLVYEYMSNGSLGNLIFVGKSQRRPEWDERVRIAVEIARGIMYLHEECEAPIIHCDIKPENILVDEFWTAKISDFGLAKLLMPDQTRTMTRARGTRGYVAPEWNKNVPISVKTDVYSYGIMLLEILCCRRNFEVHVSEPEAVMLSTWAYNCFVAGKLNKLFPWEVVDDKTAVENMLKVALWCIQDEPFLRPTMKSVVLMLEGVTDIAIPPCPTSNSA